MTTMMMIVVEVVEDAMTATTTVIVTTKTMKTSTWEEILLAPSKVFEVVEEVTWREADLEDTTHGAQGRPRSV